MTFSRTPKYPHLAKGGRGLKDEVFQLRQDVADALGSVVGGGGGWTYVLNSLPGAVPDPSQNVFVDFAAMMAVLDVLPTGVTPIIQFVGNVTLPLVGMPVTGWNMRLGEWRSPVLATGAITVTIPEGVMIDSLSFIKDGLLVEIFPTATTTFNWNYWESLAPGGAVWVFGVGLGAALRNGGSIPCIQGPGTGKYIVFAVEAASFFAVPPSTAPFVNADAPDLVIESQSLTGFYGSLPDGWLTGSAGRIYQRSIDARPAVNPGATGPVVFAAQSVVQPAGQTTTRKTLIYTNMAFTPTETDTFDDFEKFYEIYSALVGPVDIEFKQDPTGPSLEIPAKSGGGFWQMKLGTRWTSAASIGSPCQVSLLAGAEVRDLTYVGDNVAIIGNGGQLTWSPPSPGGNPTVLALSGLGCVLATQGVNPPLIDWGYDIGLAGPMIIAITKAASITKGGGGGPVINVTPLGAYQSGVVIYNLDGVLDENTVSGSDGPGTALLGFIVRSDGRSSFKQPAWAAATPLGTLYQSEGRPRFNIQTAPLGGVGPYIMGDVLGVFTDTNGENGSEFVRYVPTANDVGVQLPDPAACVGQTVLFKEVSGAPAFNLILTTPSGSVEGSPGGLVITPAAYEKTRLTSDGTDWWIS